MKIICLSLGIALFFMGLHMKNVQNSWIENTKTSDVIEGNRATTTAVGATVGVAVGAGTGATIGGIGVVAMGTGVGIPVGVVCLGLAAILGAAGAGIGAAVGKSDQLITNIEAVTNFSPAYQTWEWASVMSIGVILIVSACYKMWLNKQRESVKE